jgi:predicted DNA-binding protein (UPF0278 family)
LQNLYDVGEKNIRELMQKLRQELKEEKISPEEYTKQMKAFRKKYPGYTDISDAKNREAIATHTYPISEEQIQFYMSKL